MYSAACACTAHTQTMLWILVLCVCTNRYQLCTAAMCEDVISNFQWKFSGNLPWPEKKLFPEICLAVSGNLHFPQPVEEGGKPLRTWPTTSQRRQKPTTVKSRCEDPYLEPYLAAPAARREPKRSRREATRPPRSAMRGPISR